jgi:hypothetical protein
MVSSSTLLYKVRGSNIGLQTAILSEVFCCFPQSLLANAGIVPNISQNRFLSHSFICVIY